MQNFRSKEFLYELFLLSFGSLIFLLIKIFFTKYLNENHFSIPISYLLVHSLLLILSWCYHSLITFKRKLTKSIFFDYSLATLFLKALDYIIVILLVEFIILSSTISIITTSFFLFIVRYIIFKKKIFK